MMPQTGIMPYDEYEWTPCEGGMLLKKKLPLTVRMWAEKAAKEAEEHMAWMRRGTFL